jgi:glycosyltransferase involved in cell wall biosynthesis
LCLRVTFAFAALGIGGAERSMLRLMARAHPDTFDSRVIVVGPENPELRAAAAALGVPYDGVGHFDAPSFFRAVRAAPPDVLYLFGRFRTIAWAQLARLAGVRCIVAAERSAANRRSDRLARTLDRWVVTAYIANTDFGARNVRGIVGRSGPPVFVVPNGVETADAPSNVERPAEPALVCVGNITPNKGHLVLLEAVRRVQSRYPRLRARLVGRDFTNGRVFQEAALRGLADTYTAVGFAADVRPHLSGATIAVLPSLYREGMPTALLEAMRAGTPIVATRVGGVAEVVEHGVTGLLVPPGDAHALAEAIGRLLEDDAERVRLAGNGRRLVVERHGLGAMVEGHRQAFEWALSRRRSRTRAAEVARRRCSSTQDTP